MRRFNWIVLALGLTGLASVGLVACGDDEPTACEADTDCGDGEICAKGTCAEVCQSADDCSNDDHACSGKCPDTAQPICFLPCAQNEDCPEGQVCDTDFCGGVGEGRCGPPAVDECATDDQCDAGQFCNLLTATCQDKCTSNDDCEESGQLCHLDTGMCVSAGGGCTSSDQCGEGEVCKDSKCIPANPNACEENAECYDKGNSYCGTVGDETACVDTSCGVAFNACSRCTLGSNGGSRQSNGPVVFAADQVQVGSSNCEPMSKKCGGAGVQLLCKFSFHFFDPDGDFEPTNKNVFVVNGKGVASTAFDVKKTDRDKAEFGACFADGANSPGTAFFVKDGANNASNTLCVNGSR